MKILAFLVAFLSLQSVNAADSTSFRQDKKFQATYQQGFDYQLWTESLTASYFLDPDVLLGIHAGYTKEGNRVQSSFAVQSKYFLGNSFYVAPELYYYSLTNRSTHSSDDKLRTLGISARIGNQWQFKNFTLGCDWFGLGRNLIYFQRTDHDSWDQYSLTLLNFYLGWSF